MILPVQGTTSSAIEHSFIPCVYALRTLRVICWSFGLLENIFAQEFSLTDEITFLKLFLHVFAIISISKSFISHFLCL